MYKKFCGNAEEIKEWVGEYFYSHIVDEEVGFEVLVITDYLSILQWVYPHDYILKHPDGSFMVCNANLFELMCLIFDIEVEDENR